VTSCVQRAETENDAIWSEAEALEDLLSVDDADERGDNRRDEDKDEDRALSIHLALK
jgi:hypothetical protein